MKEIAIIKQLLYLLRRISIHPLFFLIPITLSIFAAAFEGVGMGLLVPMLEGFLTKDYSFIKEVPGLQAVISFFPQSIAERDRSLFAILLGLFVSSTLLKNILRYSAGVSMAFIGVRSLHHLRKILFERYLGFGKLYFDRTNVGHHQTVFAEFAPQALSPLLAIDKHINALFSLIGYIVVMSVISWKLTLFALPLFALLHFAIHFMIEKMRRLSYTIAQSASTLGKKTVEILSVIPLVKTANMESAEKQNYTKISDQKSMLEFKRHALQKMIMPFQETLTLFAILFLFTGMLYLLLQGEGSAAPPFIIYFYLVLNAGSKFGTITGFRAGIANSSGPIEEVLHVLDDTDKHAVPSGSLTCADLKDAIAFRDLQFTFPNGKKVMNGLSFRIEQGKMTAIVGPTGAGKTTIINFLLRMYDCPPGSILFDDVDIREFSTASIRYHIALVSQDTLLLHDTVRSNISYGLGNVSEDQLRRAIEQAQLQRFVEQLPQGLETLIGDRGVKLSGGEKQRFSIARALLKDADILILDEATSSLDSETEKLIQAAIDAVVAGRTSIVIAHRLSTIRHADTIVTIEDGRCVEAGSVEELLANKGKFFELWEAQKFS